MQRFYFLFPASFILIAFAACTENKIKPPSSVNKLPPAAETKAVQIIQSDSLKINFHFLRVDSVAISKIREKFSEPELQIICAINRIDYSKLYKTDTLIVPDTIFNDLMLYAPFPQRIPLLHPVRKVLIFSYRIQAFAAYENGILVRWGPTSMGKRSTPTPSGLFFTNWKAKKTISTDNEEWILKWYFNIVNESGVSIHEYELPGFPASHACMRLFESDAQWLYYWAEQWKLTPDERTIVSFGTPVIIFGAYNFGYAPPWYQLTEDPKALDLPLDSLNSIIEPYMEIISDRQTQKDSVMQGIEKSASRKLRDTSVVL